MDIHDANLLTSSDFEHIMEDLKSDTNFPPLNVNQDHGQEQRNGKSIDALIKPTNPLLSQNFGKMNEKTTDSLELAISPALEVYSGVQDISEPIETVEMVQSSTPADFLCASFSPTSTLPCTDDYAGPLNFEIFLDSTTAHKKSWVFSTLLRKVFIDMNKTLLVKFRTQERLSGLFVRALPVYSGADHLSVPVQRCTVHELNDDGRRQAHTQEGHCLCHNFQFVRHVVRTTHAHAHYDYDRESDRHSVLVPLDAPQPGCDLVVVEYFFTCKTSCPHGMNRKPIDVIFTLETEHCEVVGRQVLPVKVCSCPKRDKDKEETDAKANGGAKLKLGTLAKRRLSSSEKQDSALKKVKTENEVEAKQSTCHLSDDNLNQNSTIANKATVNDANSLNILKLLEMVRTQSVRIDSLQNEIALLSSQVSHIDELRKEMVLLRGEIAQQRTNISFGYVTDLSSKLEGRLEAIFQFLLSKQDRF